MQKSNLLLNKGDLCRIVSDHPPALDAALFRTDGMPECFKPNEIIIYIRFYGHVLHNPYHLVLTRCGLMRVHDKNIIYANIL